MDSPRKMDVTDWQDSPLPMVPKPKGRRRSLPPALIGILGTLLLHATFIQSVSFGSQGPNPKPPESQESANASSESAADADNLILISLSTISNASQAASGSAISSLPDLSKMKIQPDVHVDSPELYKTETLALSEDQDSTPIASGADGAELARLFGIYTGQIQARIDRVWRRPRSPVNEVDSAANANVMDSFQCEVQIVQDARGNVQEILLPRCNGSPAWKRSLILAIQEASPLPAPPDPSVFSRSIALRFVGLPYSIGAPDDEYEVLPRSGGLALQAN